MINLKKETFLGVVLIEYLEATNTPLSVLINSKTETDDANLDDTTIKTSDSVPGCISLSSPFQKSLIAYFDNDVDNFRGLTLNKYITSYAVGTHKTGRPNLSLSDFANYWKNNKSKIADYYIKNNVNPRIYDRVDILNDLMVDKLQSLYYHLLEGGHRIIFWDWDRTLTIQEGNISFADNYYWQHTDVRQVISYNNFININNTPNPANYTATFQKLMETYNQTFGHEQIEKVIDIDDPDFDFEPRDLAVYYFGGEERAKWIAKIFNLDNINHIVISNNRSFDENINYSRMLYIRGMLHNIGVTVINNMNINLVYSGYRAVEYGGFTKPDCIYQFMNPLENYVDMENHYMVAQETNQLIQYANYIVQCIKQGKKKNTDNDTNQNTNTDTYIIMENTTDTEENYPEITDEEDDEPNIEMSDKELLTNVTTMIQNNQYYLQNCGYINQLNNIRERFKFGLITEIEVEFASFMKWFTNIFHQSPSEES